MKNQNEVGGSSGNVFADLGLPNPEERILKSRIAEAISDVIEAEQLTQQAAADRLG